MSNELIIRSSQKDLISSKQSEARRKLEACLERLKASGSGLERSGSQPHLQPASTSSFVIDLPRICAVHDRAYVARYVSPNGRLYRFAQSIRFADATADQYRSHMATTLSAENIAEGDENCPWCGARGFGAVRCDGCNADVCFGKTTSKKVFACRDSCGLTASLTPSEHSTTGLRPSLPERRSSFSTRRYP